MSSLQVDNIQSYNANPPVIKSSSGAEVGTFCRAWVNFNGTGTVAIRASFNVSSITDNSTGNYTVNFTTALADANYAVTIGTMNIGTNTNTANNIHSGAAPTTTAFRIEHVENSATTDTSYINAAVFR